MDEDTIIAILVAAPLIIYIIYILKSDYENSQPITPEQIESNRKEKEKVDKRYKEVINEWIDELEKDKKTYIILTSIYETDEVGASENLEEQVNIFIERGWKLQGGLYENSDAYYCQAMTRKYK